MRNSNGHAPQPTQRQQLIIAQQRTALIELLLEQPATSQEAAWLIADLVQLRLALVNARKSRTHQAKAA